MSYALGLGLTNECNLSCGHCYRSQRGIQRLSLEQVRAVCENLPLRTINLGTGENGLHPEFREMLRYLHGTDAKISLTSNGYTLNSLSEDELRVFHDVELSLDFPTQGEQDAFRGWGSWRMTLDAQERCRHAGLMTTITAVLMNINYHRLVDLSRLAVSLGAALRVHVYQPVVTDAFTPSYAQFWEGFEQLFSESTVVACTEPLLQGLLGLDAIHGCGRTTVRVTPAGRVLPCVYWPLGSLGLNELRQLQGRVVETDLFRQLRVIPIACRDCEYLAACGGGCPSRRALRGRLDQPDEYCPVVRGDGKQLLLRRGETQDRPKAGSACTTIVEGQA